uniref:Uncharacterized protein n=1 Tax=Populus trichocarpa TaxID=3694 RepID=A0A3N7FGB8_POPTR
MQEGKRQRTCLCKEAKSKTMAMKMLGCWSNGRSLLCFFLFFTFSLRVCLMLELDDEDHGKGVLVCQSYLISFSVSVLRALLLWSSALQSCILGQHCHCLLYAYYQVHLRLV